MKVNQTGLWLMLATLIFLGACTDPKQEATALFNEAADLNNKALESEGAEREAFLKATADKLGGVIEKDPKRLDAHLALVTTLWELPSRQVEAVRMVESLTEKFADSHEVWNRAGELYSSILKWKDSINAYEKALETGGDAVELHMKIGIAAGKCNDLELAFASFDEAEAAGAESHVVNFHLGLCYEGSRQYDLAMKYYMKSLEGDELYLPVINKLASVFQDNKLPGTPNLTEALKYAKKAFELTPSDIKVLPNLVDILIIKKDYESALEAVETAVSHNPSDPALLKYKSALLELMKDDLDKGENN